MTAPDGALTYAELARWSGRIAGLLAAAGVGRGDRVAIWAHRGGSLVPAALGTLAAGAAFVMLDPAYPAARLAELVALAKPRGFLRLAAARPVPEEVAAALATAGCRVEVGLPPLAELSALPADHPLATAPEAAPLALGPDDLAYLAFTSGSTGRPKGILGRHGSLTHFVPWQVDAFGFGADDRFSLLSGLAHDPLHRDLFTPLQTGGAIVVPEGERIGEPGYLAGWLRRQRVTVAHLTPAMGQVVAEPAARPGGVPAELVAGELRWVFLVGEALTRGHVDRLAAVAPGARVVNYYGSTETQRAVGWHLCEAGGGASEAAEVLPLGRGIPDVQLLVVNPAGRPAGVGELGEVWVRSPHVALGYLDDPAATAARFLANPFAAPADPADRVYRTGDLGRYRPDGEVVFAGRADLQLKVRGFRVEPAEIEAALERHPAVGEAVVGLREDPAAGALLVAWLTARSGAEPPAPRALREHLLARLPEYMVPAAFVLLPALPRTPNGKLDRRALPAPAAGDGVAGARTVATGDPIEDAVAAVFAELLPGAPDTPAGGDDFFALGGHSLLATRAVSRLRALAGVELPLRALFEAPTPRALAPRVAAA
ncbi:MAG TPA: amino acid adenylation domain-containing protein, partial [Thermoanaerobaculia bacterium]|nr:amino acid adenylation domain-containing protein [Thermoanaerobaculia bacterium]